MLEHPTIWLQHRFEISLWHFCSGLLTSSKFVIADLGPGL